MATPTPPGPASRHRVVVVGAGFGGLAVLRGLRGAPVDVTLVDANNFHTFQPLLYQVATAGLAADDVAYAVRGIVRRHRNVAVRMASVLSVDVDARTVVTDSGAPLHYDSLVIAAGAVSATFDIPGVDEHAFNLKSVADAVRLREHLLARFEAAAADRTIVDDGALNVVVCGGGSTGVEMAGGVMELFSRVLTKDFPDLPVARARVIVVEAADRLLGTFSPLSGERARRTLASRNVEVLTGVGVASADAAGVLLTTGEHLPAHTLVWAPGVKAHALAESTGLELGRGGRIVVGDDLATPSHPEVFAIGDISINPTAPLPQVAQPAIQGGRHVAEQIVRTLDGRPRAPFTYVDKGSMATIGRHDAVAEFPSGRRLTGFVGWLAWLGLHIVYLMGFRNRANVLVNWSWNYLTYDRGSRLVASPASRRTP